MHWIDGSVWVELGDFLDDLLDNDVGVKLFLGLPSPQCISEYLLILSRTFWYPSYIGTTEVSQQRFGDPNGSWASSWWHHHPISTNITWVPPKTCMNIVDQVWLKSFTIWTILTKLSFFTTSVANLVLDVAWWIVLIVFDYLPLQIFFLSFLEAFVWLEVPLCFRNRNFRITQSGTSEFAILHAFLVWTCSNSVSLLTTAKTSSLS